MDQFNLLLKQAQYLVLMAFLLGLGLVGLVGVLYLLVHWLKFKDREKRSLEFVVLQIAVPRDNEVKIDGAEQMFASLFSVKKSGGFLGFLKPQDHLSFEIVARKEDIRFYVSVPERLKDLVEKQIHGTYPGADIKEVDEYNVFSDHGKVAFAAMKLANASFYPIQIFKDLPTDPLSSLTAGLAKMGDNEGAVVQVLISPANNKWQKGGRSFISKTKKEEADPETAKYNIDPKTYEEIENKCSKPGFETIIRMVVSSTTKESAEAHLSNLTSSFSQYNSDHNSFTKVKMRLKKLFMIDFIYRYQPLFGAKSILSTEELATIYHFPNKSVETPHIFWLSAKRAPAPALIPRTGLFLGKSVYRGVTRPVYISEDDRLRHTYIIGKTGVGKSELLIEMIMQDIRAGKGVCFIDPHDTVEKILEMIPPERAEDVIYFNPSDTDRPMALNMLEAKTEEEKHFVTTSIVGLMYKLYDPHKTGIIGPRFEHAIRNAMLTVMSEPGSTFVEVVRVLTDAKYVQELLPKVKDPMVRRYWTDQIAQTSDFHKSEVLDYIVSKFGRFVTNKMMRNIIGQSDSAFNFRKVMDEGKILLINLAKGRIGEENSQFLGLIIVPKILIGAMSRQDIPEEQRKPFYLYVDEFQNFATPDFAQILSEARKFGLSLTVANQFIGQMEEEVKNAIFGNVGTLVSFRVGVNDANYLQHEYQPVFSETDLINVERFNAYIKTIVNNEPVQPFSLDLTKDMSKAKDERSLKMAEMVKQLSRLRYARDVNVIEAEIMNRSKM
ncbi:MAG: type IV secretion system DNA-binding domain-containing protein [Patescibacteria group bacterium]|nr:type IV secretion system DNA-binding domain-containing protein [Patescibacteria group bacterium]